MGRKRGTGDGEPYTPGEEAELETVLDNAFEGYGPGEPTGADVTAQIEWAGTVDNNGRGGVRTTRLDGLDPDKVREVREAVDKAHRQAERGQLRSYEAKGWYAQITALTGVKRGEEASARAGLAPSRTTLLRWLSGEQAPSKENQARISQAYDELRNPARATRSNAAEKLTEAVKDRYGVTVRFREIQSWTWR